MNEHVTANPTNQRLAFDSYTQQLPTPSTDSDGNGNVVLNTHANIVTRACIFGSLIIAPLPPPLRFSDTICIICQREYCLVVFILPNASITEPAPGSRTCTVNASDTSTTAGKAGANCTPDQVVQSSAYTRTSVYKL